MTKQPQPATGDEACETCAFSEITRSNDALFFCRRRAPVNVANTRAVWPIVDQDDWCGEYRAG